MHKSQFVTQLLDITDNMYSFALKLTANKDDAQDLLQDTILKVLDNHAKFVENTNFKGWVLTVMRNIFINNYNKILRSQSVMDMDADIYNLDSVDESGIITPEAAFYLKELNSTIDTLKEENRVPFFLFAMGYKYEEIADKLSIPIGTVKSRIHLARRDLQKLLEE